MSFNYRTTLSSLSLLALSVGLTVSGCGDDEEKDENQNDSLGGRGGQGGSQALLPPLQALLPDVFCESDKACRDNNQVCDTARYVCVDCLSDNDCGEESICEASTCSTVTACTSTKDCSLEEVCASDLGRCVECNSDADCLGGASCDENRCVTDCSSAKECRATNSVCDADAGFCTECVSDADCSDGYCNEGSCAAPVCTPEMSYCNGDSLVQCNAAGSALSVQNCNEGCANSACIGGSAPANGGGNNGSGGNSSDEPEEPVCSPPTGDYCNSIPALDVTPTIDGQGDEYCGVPTQTITFANSEYTRQDLESADTGSTEAEIRVGWRADALYLHAKVVDPSIKHSGNQWYNGDALQIFIGSKAPSDGNLITDEATQIGLPIDPPGGINDQYIVGYSTGEALDYVVTTTSDGYEMEMKWPWLGTAPQADDRIAFNFQVTVQNDEYGLDYEYALRLAPAPEDSGCNQESRQAPWCDARLWCSPTLD
ncbi:MAG: hypothetical protein MK135_13385 [Polyangiaceae bacterium]|nr:hypothetical protein [Polyangiaceae bacterium]